MFKRRQTTAREEGFVSLFTVIFFMMLISVITIGFLRIMGVEQRQALDNDLTASALAAAESGIEDAKRAILKYNSLPDGDALKNDLRTALNSSDCDALFSSSAITTALNISNNGSITGSPNLNQYYTCLSVNLNSADYVSSSTAGKSEYIPLRSEGNAEYDQIKVSWHLATATAGAQGDGMPQRYATSNQLPQVTGSVAAQNWSTRGYPAYMRVQLYGYPDGTIDRAKINDRSRSIFMIPSTVGTAETTPIDFGVVDPLPHTFNQDKTPLQQIQCKGTGTPPNVPAGTYACTATLKLPSDPAYRSNINKYFLRVTPQYGSTHFKVELRNSSSGNTVNFSEVQPIVDVTGRASDVFRRVQARVRLDAISDLPEYSLESAGDVCKNMQVADGSFFQPNNCP